jgi:PhnB protein
MATLNPYLNFAGNTEEAFTFYKSVFGGEFVTVSRFKDTPHGDNMSAEDKEKLMHIALPIGKGNVLMGTDTLASSGHTLNVGNNVSLSLSPESEAETEQLFNGISAGGTVIVPLEKAFWGAYFGMCIDKFGITWMVNYELKK